MFFKRTKTFFVYFSIFIFSKLYSNEIINSVEHKNTNISNYLDDIKEDQEEKTQILEHILEKSKGLFVDLGTGGDSISYILDRIPEDFSVELIASDIEQSTLNSIPERHPEVLPFLNQKDLDKVRLKLLKMDATNMSPLRDCSVDGFSASALVHEIFSYVPLKNSLEQFFFELIRALKKEGVFIYRDPKWDDNPKQDCILVLKEQFSKFFTVLFLPRFLDKDFSKHLDYKNECSKPNLYDNSHIRINFFYKDLSQTKKLKLKDFINVPLNSIDFTKNISIEVPRGLVSEIQRHYILFLKNIFITDLVDKNFFDRKVLDLANLPSEERATFECFLRTKNIYDSYIDTSAEIFQRILLEKKRFYSFIENGLWAKILNKDKVSKLCLEYYSKGISQSLLFIKDDRLWIDPKVAILLFQGLDYGLFNYIECDNNYFPLQVFEWLKREGEEFYFYKTTDDLISYLGRLSNYCLKGTSKEGYVLCPIFIKSVARNLYKYIIDNQMSVINLDGCLQGISFDKNIIHFKLIRKEEAIKFYKDLIKSNKQNYTLLKGWLENEF